MDWLDRLKQVTKTTPVEGRNTGESHPDGTARIIPFSGAAFAWLDGEELRTRGAVQNLESEIVRLTSDNLPLQRVLLERHCEEYDRHHIWRLWLEWEERAAIIQFDGGLTRGRAEIEAARCLNLLAFIGERECTEA